MTSPHSPQRGSAKAGPRGLLQTLPLGSLALAAVLAVSGCSIPGLPGATGAPAPVQKAAVVQPMAPEEPAAAEPTEPAVPAWIPVSGDLAKGSVTHTLGAAARHLIIDYWMDQDPTTLTPDDSPILRLSARLDGAPDAEAIQVTRFTATALGTILANDTGNFAVQPPYSYSSGVVVPANPTAHSTVITFTFDLLTETAPGTGVFSRQTIVDAVTVGYALPGKAAGN